MSAVTVDFAFCPELDSLLRSRKTVGETGRVYDGLGALSTTNNLEILRRLMLDRKPERTLEIGLSFGGSALVIAASHRDLQRSPAMQHVTIDPYQNTVWDNTGVASLRRAGLEQYVEVRRQFSSAALAQLLDQKRAFDLIYVDGSHLFEDVFVDAYFGFRLLSDTGLILFDDCVDDHVARVLRFVRTNWADWAAEVDVSNHRSDGASWRYRLAKRLGRVQLRAFRRIAAEPRWKGRLLSF
jgi:predicted O-methyltransferase YrrM